MHGRTTKLKEEGSIVVLRIENTRYAKEPVYQTMTVHLRKPSMLPAKIVVKENPDTEVTYEFTVVHDDVELSEDDFLPPKLNSRWKVDRPKFENGRLFAEQQPKPQNQRRRPLRPPPNDFRLFSVDSTDLGVDCCKDVFFQPSFLILHPFPTSSFIISQSAVN